MRKKMSRSTLLTLFVLVVAVGMFASLLWYLFVPPADYRVSCIGLSDEAIHERWTSGDIQKRRSVLDCVTGGQWNGSHVGSPNRGQSQYTGDFDVSSSMLAGMNKQEVIAFLGTPDSDRTNSIWYSLGITPQNGFDRLFNGWGLPTRSLSMYFDEETGEIYTLYISGQ